MRLALTGDTWIDPTTIKIGFDLVNLDVTANHDLKPLGQPFLFIRRARVLCGSALVEDKDLFGCFSQQMHMLQARNKRINDFVEAFDGEKVDSDADLQVIPPSGRSTCMFTPCLGLLTQDRYLPLRYAPITLELEI